MAAFFAPVSGREFVKKLKRAGWTFDRQQGSHMMLTHPGYRWTLSVPDHRELGQGLIRKLLKQAGLTIEQFRSL
jgi:predicted RNA binding protein YcfA (HicA-like mRNA interferase family)